MRWTDEALEAVLGRAAAEGRELMVKVHAEWCDGCVELEREVLCTAAAARLFGDHLAVRVDFDAEGSHALVERFAILELPTLLVLRADGSERARITGFVDAARWLEEARAALACEDQAAELARALAASPGDRALMLRLGELELARSPGDGEARLAMIALGEDELAAHALFLLARFHHRARRDAKRARSLWRELALRFPDGPYAKGAFAWLARAEAELGHPEVGAAALEARATRRPSPEAVLEWARFVDEHGLRAARAKVRAAALRVLDTARGAQREALEEIALGWS